MLAISSSSISTTGQSLNRNRKVHKLVALEKEELCRQWTKKRLKLSICMLSGKRKLVPRCCLLSSQFWLSLSSYRFVLFLPISTRKNDLPFDFRPSSSLRNHLHPHFTSFPPH